MKAFTIVSAVIVILVLSAMLLPTCASAEDVRHAEAYRHIRVVVGDTGDTVYENVSVKMAAPLSSNAQSGVRGGMWPVILGVLGINAVFLTLAIQKKSNGSN